MINVNEVRLGNWFDISAPSSIWKKENDGSVTQIIRAKYGQVEIIRKDSVLVGGFHSKDFGQPIPLNPEILEKAGFEDMPHFTVGRIMNKNIGRDRVLSISCAGTPNEMVCINEEEPPTVKSIIVARNFDYDGATHLHQLQNLYFALTGTELEINL